MSLDVQKSFSGFSWRFTQFLIYSQQQPEADDVFNIKPLDDEHTAAAQSVMIVMSFIKQTEEVRYGGLEVSVQDDWI